MHITDLILTLKTLNAETVAKPKPKVKILGSTEHNFDKYSLTVTILQRFISQNIYT